MWRLGALLVLSVIFCCSSTAGHENFRVRLKRSPHYPCQPYFYDSHQSHPRHFPHPPPFWGGPPPPPPPPQRYYQERQNYDNELSQQNFNQNHQKQEQNQAYSDAGAPANPTDQGISFPDNKPCDKCHKGQSTAISNAKSVSGSAVAVAIAGKGNNADDGKLGK